MVEKGLKVGDVFQEGTQQYEVLEVLPDGNYISKATEKPRKSVKKDGKD